MSPMKLSGLLMCEAYPGICLREHLLASYDKIIRPVKKQNDTVTVELRLDVVYIDVMDIEDYISVGSKTFVTWTDEYLTWTPQQYEGVENISINSDNIWTPDITLISLSAVDFSLSKFPSTECTVHSSGRVTCLPDTHYIAHCEVDMRNWPYDVHMCDMWFSSWSHRANHVNTTFYGTGIDTSKMVKHRVWEVVKEGTSRMNHGDWPTLGFEFTLRRHATGHKIRVVFMGAVLSLMTLLSWLLPPDCSQRLILCVVSLFLHIFNLLHVAFETYFCGNTLPRLVLLLRDSLVITCMSLMGAVLSQALFSANRPIPEWLNNILISPTGRALMFPNSLPSQQQTAEEDSDGKSNTQTKSAPAEWKLAAIVLDHCCLYALILTYIILLAVTISI